MYKKETHTHTNIIYMSNNQEENEEIKKRRPSPLRIEILKEESRNNNNTVKEPSTPLSSEHFEYSTYRTRYNWFVNKESSRRAIS